MKIHLWIGSWLTAFWVTTCAIADTELQFPNEAVGEISSRPTAFGNFGYSLDNSSWQDWEHLGPARGKVTIPDGHHVRLQLNSSGAKNLFWVDSLEPNDITQLIASRTELDDQEFAKLARLSGLHHLDVGSNNLTDAIAEGLAGLYELRYLSLSHMLGVGDELMITVAEIPNLEQVGIGGTSTTDDGLAALAGSQSLRGVDAGHTKITDKGVAALMAMPTIRAVRFYSEPEEFRRDGENHPEITDDVANALCGRPELELLDLSAARISDQGLARLAKSLKHLRQLRLDNTQITREGLLHVKDVGEP